MKYNKTLTVKSVDWLNPTHVLIKLTDVEPLPPVYPGQFVQVKVSGSPSTFLRRPISINFLDEANNELWLLVQLKGEGTRKLSTLIPGDTLDLLFPLGNGFSREVESGDRILLVGGGVGVAPLLEYGKYIKSNGGEPIFLLGTRTRSDLLELDLFEQYGPVYTTTEDGSYGEKGFVTQHTLLNSLRCSRVAVCGPKPMMVAVAKYSNAVNLPCEVSLENLMACGLGACLCCVEKTVRGNVCVCTEGPVFNISQLTWDLG